jgi:RNA polymerase sigma-32 factor
MSKTTIALEAAVAAVITHTPKDDTKQTGRQRLEVDRAFARILKLIAPRIRHFIRQYGLSNHWDDAEQACAIAVHRAIQSYEPEKAQFTTFVNWQIRGELQSLRFRLMTDQRPSAKKVDATTISLNMITHGPDGEETSLESVIEDESAMALTEAGASDYLADSAMRAMVDSYIDHLRTTALGQLKRRPRPNRPAYPCEVGSTMAPRPRLVHGIDAEELEKLDQRLKRNREIVESRLFDMGATDMLDDDKGITKERVRQITKRAVKTIAELAGSDPKFQLMANYRKAAITRTRARPIRADKAFAAQTCPPSAAVPETPLPGHDGLGLPAIDMSVMEGMMAWPIAAQSQSMMRH